MRVTPSRLVRLFHLAGVLAGAGVVGTSGLALTQSACIGEKCLAEQENCSLAYKEEHGLQDYHCCNGTTCKETPTSGGVPICAF